MRNCWDKDTIVKNLFFRNDLLILKLFFQKGFLPYLFIYLFHLAVNSTEFMTFPILAIRSYINI